MPTTVSRSTLHAARLPLYLILASAGIFYFVFILRTAFEIDGQLYFTLRDDAMVSMRYARNLAEGHGLLWNPGGEPVEGYTNFLWVLWMAILHLMPVAEAKLSLLVSLTGAVLLLANAWVVWEIATRISSRTAATIALVLTAFYYPLIYWTLRGMEVGLLTLLINLALLQAVRWRRGESNASLSFVAVLLSLSVLTRPDAVVPAGVVAVGLISMAPEGRRLKCFVTLMGAVGLTLAAHTAFRLLYYGDPLPNTYYLKITGVTLAERLGRGVEVLVPILKQHLLVPIVVALYSLRRIREPQVGILWAMFLALVFYSIYVGGDAWEYFGFANRYIAVGMPALLILVGIAASELFGADSEKFSKRQWVPAGLVLLVLLVAGLTAVADSLNSSFTLWYRWLRLATGLPLLAASVLGLRLVSRNVSGDRGAGGAGGVGGAGGAVPRLRTSTVVLLAGAVWLGSNAVPIIGQWLPVGGVAVPADNAWARLGVVLDRTTSADVSLAVVAAGNVSYFSHRRTEDILGKNDRVIARMEPRDEFLPGHDRWDYRHTAGVLRPDVLVMLWSPTRSDYEYLYGLGYREIGTMVDESGRNYCFANLGEAELPCHCQDGSYPHGVMCTLMVAEGTKGVDRQGIINEWIGSSRDVR